MARKELEIDSGYALNGKLDKLSVAIAELGVQKWVENRIEIIKYMHNCGIIDSKTCEDMFQSILEADPEPLNLWK